MSAVTVVRRRLEVKGVVQGVGFRPFVVALAADLGMSGRVLNHSQGVSIEVEGAADRVEDFERRLVNDAPPLATVLSCVGSDVEPEGSAGFEIVASRTFGAGGVGAAAPRTLVPPDTATCADCLRELLDPADRRFRHPFITCTNCGPRLTIITDIPYDRPATTMASFPLCGACAAEYADPTDRRHHAQPIACHDCGPTLTVRDAAGLALGEGEVALVRTQAALREGRIVAIKGIGGYHLACDAANDAAVDVLRLRKRRPDKPFAVMVADLATAADLIDVSEEGAGVLVAQDRPIVLAPKRTGRAPASGLTAYVSEAVAPGLDELGIMLAYAPVHHLLFAPHPETGQGAPPVLVMTSGNLSDEPLAYEDDDALARLGGIADLFLTHDRPIHVPVEDSVVTVDATGVVPIRRSRGHAPLPVPLAAEESALDAPVILAVGAEIKNTFCLIRDDWAFCSAHIGDLGSLESQAAYARSVDQLLALHDARPTALAADLHPAYTTRAWAERRADATDTSLHLVQHHHAHLASLLAESGRLSDRVLGLAFDGTGYGCDRTIWGGEFLLSNGDVTDMQRLGHLAPFALPGGEIAVRRPLRIGLALLQVAGRLDSAPELWPAADPAEIALVTSQLARGGQPVTTSVGRLWDGLAALLGIRNVVSYEAQAAIELEVLARTTTTGYAVRLPIAVGAADEVVTLDVAALVSDVVDALRAGVGRAELARGVHEALVAGAGELTLTLARRHDVKTVGLTGGAFQNKLLHEGLHRALSDAGLEVLTHSVVPANDGGLSLGQAVHTRTLLAKGAR